MSTDIDTSRIVRSWLEEGVTELPDRVLDAVLDQVPATPQRRSWWPARRSTFMSTYVKLIAAAAALAVVAFVGYQLAPWVGPGARPTPTASPTPTALAWPKDDALALAAGRYVTGDPYPVRLGVTVPAGWHGWVAGPYYADLSLPGFAGGLYFVLPSRVAVDPCDTTKGFGGVLGPTVDDLVQALRNEPGIELTNEASTSISGYSGTQLVVTAPTSIDACTLSADGYVLWQNPLGGTSPELTGGESIRLWILDVAGNRLVVVIQESTFPAAKRTEIQAIFDSIKIEPGP